MAIGVHLLVACGVGFGRGTKRSGPKAEQDEKPKARGEDQQNTHGGEPFGGAALRLQIFNGVEYKVDLQDAFTWKTGETCDEPLSSESGI